MSHTISAARPAATDPTGPVARSSVVTGPQEPATARPFVCCNGTYRRGPDGTWRYAWGQLVPGASDLTLGARAPSTSPPVSYTSAVEELGHITALYGIDEPLVVYVPGTGHRVVVGLTAPELQLGLMVTGARLGELAGVSKATIDSYRYRGYLPEPQMIVGRTPLWTRPVVRRWLDARPGADVRTDVGATHGRHPPPRPTVPAAHARERPDGLNGDARRRHRHEP